MAKRDGLYQKFVVERVDGRSAPGEKHDGCRYFVLDLDHDKFAVPALRSYAMACRAELPRLSADLLDFVAAKEDAIRTAGLAAAPEEKKP
ncbi:MAG: hypothetical protein ABSB58_10735 [Gemmatimonadales bacterium]|jgi:hypothetical protein